MSATNSTVAAGEVGVHAIALTASTVDTVTFADDRTEIEVVSDGAAALYVRTDGGTPTVAGKFSYVLPAGVVSSRKIPVSSARSASAGGTVVTLISAGTPTYSVMG
jgi:hypothetical protein